MNSCCHWRRALAAPVRLSLKSLSSSPSSPSRSLPLPTVDHSFVRASAATATAKKLFEATFSSSGSGGGGRLTELLRSRAPRLVSGSVARRGCVSDLSTMASVKPKVVFVLGPPGSGKGTQCEKIVNKFGFVHLSAGDLLRAERTTRGSKYGDLIEGHIRNGTIVPVEITCSLIEKAMKDSGKDRFLIDGFPRNKDNLDGWEAQMGNKAEVLFVLFLSCSEEVATKRCLGRGQAGSGRSDDNAESLRKRFQTYEKDTMPIIKHYEAKNMVRKVDSNSCDKDEIFAEVSKAFQAL